MCVCVCVYVCVCVCVCVTGAQREPYSYGVESAVMAMEPEAELTKYLAKIACHGMEAAHCSACSKLTTYLHRV